ncbi:MAG: T9SS type A sorting domain-containing protein [bacterium]
MKRLLQNFVVLLLSIIFISSFARAVDNDSAQLRKDLPKLLGSSYQGTEFFMTFHPCWESKGKADGCKIYISSAVATRVTVEIPGWEVFIQRTTLPNDIIEISLDPVLAQCYRKTQYEQPKPQRVFKGMGIIVTAKEPIICYGMTRYEHSSDGYLAIPTSGLGKKYICASYNDPSKTGDEEQYLTSYTSIVGVYNKTNVDVKLGGRASNYTPGANPLKTGDTRSERLDRADVWLIGVMGENSDLTGTIVTASKPVAVISGSFCAFVPIQTASCNYLIEQDLPMETWGYKYHATRIAKRLKGSIIRVFASEPNTIIYRDGNEWSLVKSVGGPDYSGYIESRTTNNGEELRPVTISAKNRISVTQYNSGQNDDGIDTDPFQISLIPIEQYQNSLIWCTPGFDQGSPFSRNYINLCYKSTEEGKIPDNLEFGKVSGGVMNWRKLSTVVDNPGQVLVDESITDSRNYRALTIETQDPAGVYALRSNDPMIGYAYGFDSYDSYGYPVSAAMADLSKPDIWAPIPTYTNNCNGEVLGRVIDQPANDEILRSNLADLRLVKGESYNFTDITYDEANFEPGITYIMDWSLHVIEIESDAKAVLGFIDRAGNDTIITIDFQRTKLSIKNRIENWGVKKVSDPPETRSFTLIIESANPVIVDSIFLLSTVNDRKWAYNGFKLDSSIYKKYGGVLPNYSLKPGEALPFKVTFDPASVNDDYLADKLKYIDSIGIKANWSDDVNNYCYWKYRSAVRAALGSRCINVGRIDFGQEINGCSVTREFTISNSSTNNLEITGYSLPAPPDVYQTNLGAISADNPLLIPAGESKKFNVVFKPDAYSQYPSQIVFESNTDLTCPDYDPILELTGEGIELTITDIPDLNIDENTTANVPFSINSDNSSSIKFLKESDDETIIPKDSIIVTGIGTNCNAKITPIQNKIGSCNLTIVATNGMEVALSKFKVTVNKAGNVYYNLEISDITLVPNPANTNFSIMSKSLLLGEVEIYSVLGILVLKTENLYDIDISYLTAGIYYCIIKSGNNYFTRKFELVK